MLLRPPLHVLYMYAAAHPLGVQHSMPATAVSLHVHYSTLKVHVLSAHRLCVLGTL